LPSMLRTPWLVTNFYCSTIHVIYVNACISYFNIRKRSHGWNKIFLIFKEKILISDFGLSCGYLY